MGDFETKALALVESTLKYHPEFSRFLTKLHYLVLVAALPSASNVSLLAERFGADTGRIARIILVSTALAFLTFSGAVSVLR